MMISEHAAGHHEGQEGGSASGGPGVAPRFYRSRSDRMVAGVAGGLAQYFGLNPVLVRLGIVLLTITTGIGLIGYIVLALITPERPAGETEPQVATQAGDGRGRQAAGVALLAVGLITLASNWGLMTWMHWGRLWPVFLVIGGVALLLNRTSGNRSN